MGHEIKFPFSSEHMLTVHGRAMYMCQNGWEEEKRPSVFYMHIHGETQSSLRKFSFIYLILDN